MANAPLADSIPVRLPVAVRKQIEDESRLTGIPMSVLIRRAVMRDYPAQDEASPTGKVHK